MLAFSTLRSSPRDVIAGRKFGYLHKNQYNTTDLVQAFKTRPQLWNKKLKDYSNRQKKKIRDRSIVLSRTIKVSFFNMSRPQRSSNNLIQ